LCGREKHRATSLLACRALLILWASSLDTKRNGQSSIWIAVTEAKFSITNFRDLHDRKVLSMKVRNRNASPIIYTASIGYLALNLTIR
jgi:hypothetical protein